MPSRAAGKRWPPNSCLVLPEQTAMPVLLDRGHSRSAVLGAPSGFSVSEFTSQHTLDLALINNMPDAAIEATERQFANLLAAASGQTLVRLRTFALDEVPRSLA